MHEGGMREEPRTCGSPTVSWEVRCLKDGKIRRGGCSYRKKAPYYEGIVGDARDAVFHVGWRAR